MDCYIISNVVYGSVNPQVIGKKSIKGGICGVVVLHAGSDKKTQNISCVFLIGKAVNDELLSSSYRKKYETKRNGTSRGNVCGQ